MHLAFLTPEYPHPRANNVGGMGTSIKNLVNSLVAEGVKITIFIYGQKDEDVFFENGINFHFIKHKSYPLLGWFYYRKHIQKYVNNHIIEYGIEAIEAPDWTGVTAFMKLKCPLVIRFHGSDTYFCFLEKRRQKLKNKILERLAVRSAKAFIAPTNFAGKLSSKCLGVNIKKVSVIPYGLNLELFNNISPKDYKLYSLVNVGTIIRKKGLFQLAKIFNKVIEIEPRATLTLIGNDSQDIQTGSSSTWSLLQNCFSKIALKRVNYLGKIPYEEVKVAIANAHICVYPSLAETLGMVTIESMALQKPVINTDYGWAQDLIDDKKDGYLIDPDNINDYVNVIVKLFENKGLTNEIGKLAKLKVMQKFDVKNIVRDNINFYKRIIKA